MGFDIVERIMIDNPEYNELDKIAWFDEELHSAYLKGLSEEEKEQIGIYIAIGLLAGQSRTKSDNEKRAPHYFRLYYEVSGVV